MGTEVLLLIILGALTLIAYIIALNSHGPIHLAISYLLATSILIATVWVTVQYVNSGDKRRITEEFQKLIIEKQLAEAQKDSAMLWMKHNKERQTFAARLNGIITQADALATTILNSDVGNPRHELEVLIGKASETKRKVEELTAEYDKISIPDTIFAQSRSLIKEAIKQLSEAAQYYFLYYRAEDSAQEELRERIMRQKATEAHNLLQKADSQIVPSGG